MKTKRTDLLLCLASALVWLGTCLYAQHIALAYDGAITTTPLYLWLLAPLTYLVTFLQPRQQTESTSSGSRLGQVLVVYSITLFLYLVLSLHVDLRYEFYFWWIVFYGVLAVLSFKLPHRSKPHSRWNSTAFYLLIFYLPCTITMLLFIAVLHPLTVEQIRPIGEVQGREFIGRTSRQTTDTPLGMYCFADDDSNLYYYDVLTGSFVEQQSMSDRLTEIYE